MLLDIQRKRSNFITIRDSVFGEITVSTPHVGNGLDGVGVAEQYANILAIVQIYQAHKKAYLLEVVRYMMTDWMEWKRRTGSCAHTLTSYIGCFTGSLIERSLFPTACVERQVKKLQWSRALKP